MEIPRDENADLHQEIQPPRHLTNVHTSHQQACTVFCSVLNIAKTENRAIEALHQYQSVDMFYQRLIMTRPRALRATDGETNRWFRALEAAEGLHALVGDFLTEYRAKHVCPPELEVCLTLQEHELSVLRRDLREELKFSLIRREDQRAADRHQARLEARARDQLIEAAEEAADRAQYKREKKARRGRARRRSF